MSTQAQYLEPSAYQGRIAFLQLVTIVWMCAEALVAIFAASQAHSVALLGFGADSAIELMSAVVVLARFKNIRHLSEKRAARITGILLLALAAFILGSSILALTSPRFRAQPSYLGIGLLIAAALVMPWLAREKKTLATKTGSSALKADSVQSSVCAYLAWIALAGLVANAVFKLSWADPAAALLLVPFVLREGGEAMRGKTCACH